MTALATFSLTRNRDKSKAKLESDEQAAKTKLAMDEQAAQHFVGMFNVLTKQIEHTQSEVKEVREKNDVKINEIVTKLDECTKKHAEGERDRGRMEGRIEEMSRRLNSVETATQTKIGDSGAQPIINLTVEKHDTPLEPPPGALIIE